MKRFLLGSLIVIAVGLSFDTASAESLKTRQVVSGDLLYTVQAFGATESEALNLAESRAVHYLSVECSVPPKEARVYHQQVEHDAAGIQANVQVGVAIQDCEAARDAPMERKRSLANLAWLPSPQVVSPPHAPRPAPAPVSYRFTEAQLLAHERAIDQRVLAREAERRKLKTSFSD